MSYSFYKILHLVGIMALFLSLGGAVVRSMLSSDNKQLKKLTGITNGVAALLILVAGFGLLARLDIGFPTWVVVKVVLWVIFGALLAVANRKPQYGIKLWFLIMGLGAFAAWLGVAKPF